MSHTTTIDGIEIKDVDAMKKSVKDLQAAGVKCELKENVKPRMYSEAQANSVGVCDYVLYLPGSSYDVGFKKQANGSYAPVFDEYRGSVASQIGATCPLPSTKEGRAQHQIGRFMQGYTKHALLNTAKKEGRRVQNSTTDKNGNLVITLAGF